MGRTPAVGINLQVSETSRISIYHLLFTIYYSSMDQAAKEFLLEIEEHVDQIYLDLDALRDVESDARARRSVIDRLFRRVHSVKGSSATCGLEVVTQIAHEIENLLELIRNGRLVVDTAVVGICESANDAMAENLSLAAGGIAGTFPTGLLDQIQSVTRTVTNHSGSPDDAVLQRIPEEIWRPLEASDKHRLVAAICEGSRLFTISATFDAATFDQDFRRLKEDLLERGEIISTSPAIDVSRPDAINFLLLYTSNCQRKDLEYLFPTLVLSTVDTAGLLPSSKPKERSTVMSQTSSSVSSLANFVRTDLETLDRLISTTHEVFRRTSNVLDRADSDTGRNAELKASFLDVEDQLISLRMVSVGPTLQRAARSGRTATRLSGKEIDFEIKGSELRLDKLLIDAIGTPLIHLVRNAVDHGIENADTRLQAGKPKRGSVKIEAMYEGGRTVVRVADDGRGIDPTRIAAAAQRLGIFDADTKLDIDRSLRLIFRPGFTTSDSISTLSGRGVGLDVVENTVEQAGGELRVSSTTGVGTTFEIRLPVTFGIMDAQVVVSGGHHYCIPLSNISDTASIPDLPQISVPELLSYQPPVTQTVSLPTDRGDNLQSQTLVCWLNGDDDRFNTRQIKILVDEICSTEKVLVRSLGRHSGRWYGIAGATELSNGSLALVLDLPRLLSTYL